MSLENELLSRSQGICELCASTTDLSAYEVAPSDGTLNQAIIVCGTCKEQLEDDSKIDANHFRCLNDSMWSQVPAVQVVAYRTLKKIAQEGWPQELLDMMYLEEDVQSWADAVGSSSVSNNIPTKDSNGTTLVDGDSVTIIKDLDVKGANFVAKRGTVVKNISLTDNPEHIEGKVNGTRIVLLSCFLKKV